MPSNCATEDDKGDLPRRAASRRRTGPDSQARNGDRLVFQVAAPDLDARLVVKCDGELDSDRSFYGDFCALKSCVCHGPGGRRRGVASSCRRSVCKTLAFSSFQILIKSRRAQYRTSLA